MYSVEFERIGKRLFAEHLVGGNFGNISIRRGKEGFFIKRSGAFLDVATEPVFVTLKGDAPPEASSEYRVHLEVYKQTSHEAVVHAHPPYTIAASLVMDEIVPEDSEGKDVLPENSGRSGCTRFSGDCRECNPCPCVFKTGNCTGAWDLRCRKDT